MRSHTEVTYCIAFNVEMRSVLACSRRNGITNVGAAPLSVCLHGSAIELLRSVDNTH